MKQFVVDSIYRQFYIADRGIEPSAPETWTEDDVRKHHVAAEHIVALSPVGDIKARIISFGPDDELPELTDAMDFEVCTQIEVPSGKIGVYGWPWELKDLYDVVPGRYEVIFRGYLTTEIEKMQDYYVTKVVRVSKKARIM